jgi:signal transduction histidine kinase
VDATRGGRLLEPIEWAAWSTVSVAIATVSIATHAALYGVSVPIAFVLGLLQGGSVLLSVLRPWFGVVAQLVAVVGFAVTTSAAQGPWPMPVVGMVALAAVLVALGLRRDWRIGAATWAAAMALLVVVALVSAGVGGSTDGWIADLIVAASTTAFALFTATAVAQLRVARVEVREARQETEAERAQVLWEQERARIAREMHDVVAHSMSIVHMRATSARYRLEGLDDATVAEFDDIAEQARGAMREMRGLLGVLREGDRVLGAPQPGFADLDALLAATRSAGVVIVSDLAEISPPPPASVQLALFRVAQESLSNIVRHARGAEVFVGLETMGGELWLTVENGAPDAAADAAAGAAGAAASDVGGHGIRGMMERMASVGGTLDHGPIASGGYRVVARVRVVESPAQEGAA